MQGPIFAYTVPYDVDGNRVEYPGGDIAVKTVVDEAMYSQDQIVNIRAFGSLYSEINFGSFAKILEGLKYRLNFGPDLSTNRDGVFLDSKSVVRSGSSFASLSKDQALSYTLDNILYYNKGFDKHQIGITALQTQTQYRFESSSMGADNVPFASQKWNALTSSNLALSTWGSSLIERQLRSYMGRIKL